MASTTETPTRAALTSSNLPVHTERYDPAVIEEKWRERWERDDLYRVDDDAPGEKWYSLTMYPYPSGVLHIGHWYAFAVPDVYARMQRMRGYNVLFPMGPVALLTDAGAGSGLPGQGCGLVVSAGPDSARQRAGPGREHLRALWCGGLQTRPRAVVLPHHRLRRGVA